MNIVIPLAGKGTRFPKEFYPFAKPLIPINGKPMIQHAIESLGLSGDYHFVLRRDEHAEQTVTALRSIVPSCNIILINTNTRGPAETCLFCRDYIDSSSELVIANCDQIMWWDPGLFLSAARYFLYDGLVVTYTETTPNNSYALISKQGKVVRIREKEVISNISLNGIHYWRKGSYFIDSASQMVAANDTAINGEFYVGPTYNYMINSGYTVGIHHIPNFQHNAVGIPKDLENYIQNNEKTFAF